MTPEDDDPPLPCAAGLLASTLALMTACAMPGPEAPAHPAQRRQLARRLSANLFWLQHHPDLPPGLRRVAAELHTRRALHAAEATPTTLPSTDAYALH